MPIVAALLAIFGLLEAGASTNCPDFNLFHLCKYLSEWKGTARKGARLSRTGALAGAPDAHIIHYLCSGI